MWDTGEVMSARNMRVRMTGMAATMTAATARGGA